MPIISKIGARSWRVRAVYTSIFLVLIIGAITMIYPFLLMVSGSFKSEADLVYMSIYPKFWTDDEILFHKYAESKYNVALEAIEGSWYKPLSTYSAITLPTEEDKKHLEAYLEWRPRCRWYSLGHVGRIGPNQMLPKNARLFREVMYDRFNGDLDAFSKEMGYSLRSWGHLMPPPPVPFRHPPKATGIRKAFNDFTKTRPVEDKIIPNLDGEYWMLFLAPSYSRDIEEYNKTHGTNYDSYNQVLLTRYVPENKKQREDWEVYIRTMLGLDHLRLDPRLGDTYREFLQREKYASIDELNSSYKTNYASFEDIPFPTTMPEKPVEAVDWEFFIKSTEDCPAEAIEVHGPRQAFEDYLAARQGVDVSQVIPARLPLKAADYHDCLNMAEDLRWEFTTRNYRHVLQYVLLHGRGIINTLIYCGLAISLALTVNPLAAYALSRYKPPSTYKILLLCMAVMAFPGEVTMIPAFLLLKRFPLWPLIGGVLTLILLIWLLRELYPKLNEILLVTIAAGAAIFIGVWVVPALIGKPFVSLLNTFAALVMPTMANGFFIFLLKGFFDSLPQELYEAAEVDGAGEWTKFWTITMSLSKPILAVIALGAFTQAYSQFMMALIIIPDQKMWTLMVWLFQLQGQSHQSVVYASLVIAAVPTFLVFALCQNIIIRGIIVPSEK
jgi:multiple sugar transport system permease protein